MRDEPQSDQLDPYRVLFERSADAILIIKGDRFIDCNDATVRMLRYGTKAELLQTHPSELSPEFQPDGQRSYDKANSMMAIAFERGSHRFEWNHRRADGEVFPVEVLLTSVPEGDDFLLHVVWRDITERKRLEEDLRHAQKMEAIGKLAGGIAHDFNNLLVSIIGYTELLRDGLDADGEWHGYAREIMGAADRATRLTSQLLSISRKQVLKPEVLDLNSLLDEVARMLQRLIGERIRLHVEHADESLIIKADPGQIEQIVLNVVTNAKDAMPDGGTLSLSTRRVDVDASMGLTLAPAAYACLSVADTGGGMAPEVAAQAFDPFFTMKPRGRGTGLGLASVYGAVKQSGGDVRIESALGAGTTVEVLLPLADSAELPPPKAAPTTAAAGAGRSATVLVVEDDQAVAALIRRVLELQGHTVIEARHGEAALRVVSGSPSQIDCVLTDVVMPVMNGPEMVSRLRGERPGLPVLFMSGYADDALTDRGFEFADVRFLRKPFGADELIAQIAEILAAVAPGA